ncbi:MAG: hypothetical protein HRT71_09035 [Flavobacteriales bacterium]|nr:hypothetical protein [Flavobacteriales bacterium]
MEIFTLQKKGDHDRYIPLQPMEESMNSNHFESSGSMSVDGKTFFFASDRPGGYGALDLHMVRKLPNGKWSLYQLAIKSAHKSVKKKFIICYA